MPNHQLVNNQTACVNSINKTCLICAHKRNEKFINVNGFFARGQSSSAKQVLRSRKMVAVVSVPNVNNG